jgi:hypothetical protein
MERGLYATLTPRSKKHMIPTYQYSISLCEVIYIYIGLCQLFIGTHIHTHTNIYLFIRLLIYLSLVLKY